MSWHERPYADGSYGGGGGRFADNPLTWAPTVARIAGIRVRMHMLFILFIVLELLMAGPAFLFVLQWLFILFGCVFLHELGHCFAARRMGGTAHEVLMWPLGGLATVDAPRAPWPQFVTVVCGPLVNVAIVAVTWLVLKTGLARSGDVELFRILRSASPEALSWLSPTVWASLLFEINLYLFLFNLWPMFPMDGGRMVQCAIWPRLGYARATAATAAIGMVAAVLMGLYGLMSRHFILLGLAILGYLTCYQERLAYRAGLLGDDNAFGYDFSGGYSTVPSERPRREGWLARRRRRKAEEARRRHAEQLAAEQAEVDRILAKVHEQGLASLTRGERRTLEMATERQRQRERAMLGTLPPKEL